MHSTLRASVRAVLLTSCLGPALAGEFADEEILDEVVVIAPYGGALARDRVPARVQTATADDVDALQPLDLTELLNRGFGSVSISHAQNNPLQPDLNFRGQTASPLLGLPQGLSRQGPHAGSIGGSVYRPHPRRGPRCRASSAAR
jgi:hypothetical protein